MGVITYGAALQNEVKGWPPLVQIGSGFDMVTQNQWWDTVGTPTTEASAVPSSGEAGLDAKFLQVIKCVTDAANEGFQQVYTYADEPRIKSGSHISAAIWVATTTGGTGITVKLVNSDASFTTGASVATDGDWSLIVVEDHTCAGTSVALQVTKDATGTFYAGGNITVMLGLDAIELKPRELRYRWVPIVQVRDLASSAAFTWADEDVTAETSNLAAVAQLRIFCNEATQIARLFLRRNGSTDAATQNQFEAQVAYSVEVHQINDVMMILDDAQIFEVQLDMSSSTMDNGDILLLGYWEWE